MNIKKYFTKQSARVVALALAFALIFGGAFIFSANAEDPANDPAAVVSGDIPAAGEPVIPSDSNAQPPVAEGAAGDETGNEAAPAAEEETRQPNSVGEPHVHDTTECADCVICDFCDKCACEGCDQTEHCEGSCHEHETACECPMCTGCTDGDHCYKLDTTSGDYITCSYEQNATSDVIVCPGCHEHDEANDTCPYCTGCTNPENCYEPTGTGEYTACTLHVCDGCQEHSAEKECRFCGGCTGGDLCYELDGEGGCIECTADDCAGGCHLHNADCESCANCELCCCAADGACYSVAGARNSTTGVFTPGELCEACGQGGNHLQADSIFTKVSADGNLYNDLSVVEAADIVADKGALQIIIYCNLLDQYDSIMNTLSEALADESATIELTVTAVPANTSKYGATISQTVLTENGKGTATFNVDYRVFDGATAGQSVVVTAVAEITYEGETVTGTFTYTFRIYDSSALSYLQLESYDNVISDDADHTAIIIPVGSFTGKLNVSAVCISSDGSEKDAKSCVYNSEKKRIEVVYNRSLFSSGGSSLIAVSAATENDDECFIELNVRVVNADSRIASITNLSNPGYTSYTLIKGEAGLELNFRVDRANKYAGSFTHTVDSNYNPGVIKVADKSSGGKGDSITLLITPMKEGCASIVLEVVDADGEDSDFYELEFYVAGSVATTPKGAVTVKDGGDNKILQKEAFSIVATGWHDGATLSSSEHCYVPIAWQVNPSGVWYTTGSMSNDLTRTAMIPGGLAEGEYTISITYQLHDFDADAWVPANAYIVERTPLKVGAASTGSAGGDVKGKSDNTAYQQKTGDNTAAQVISLVMVLAGFAILGYLVVEQLRRKRADDANRAAAVRR